MKKDNVMKVINEYAGSYRYVIVLGRVLAALSALVGMVPYYDLWRIIKIAVSGENLSQISGLAWRAVGIMILSMLMYVGALMCTHVSAFRVQANLRTRLMKHIVTLPLGVFDQAGTGKIRRIVNESSAATETYIAQYGVLAPLIARPRPDGDGYEIISGHRRQYAAKLAGLDTLPVIVRQMSDDAAVILMVDSNLQREHILPSERAFAYKMKLDAMRRTSGKPSKENPRQLVGNFETADVVGKESGESGRQVQRFIRLTNLVPELLDMVDEKKIAFNPAVELSYLGESQQRDFLEAMEDTQNAPSLSQAQQLKKMAQQGEFSYEKAFDVMGQEKKSEKDTVTIKNETLRKYFPRSYTPKQMEEKIIQLLDAWQKKQQRRNER